MRPGGSIVTKSRQAWAARPSAIVTKAASEFAVVARPAAFPAAA